MEIRKEKFGKLLKEAVSEASRRSGMSVASVLIGDGVVGSTSALSWLYKDLLRSPVSCRVLPRVRPHHRMASMPNKLRIGGLTRGKTLQQWGAAQKILLPHPCVVVTRSIVIDIRRPSQYLLRPHFIHLHLRLDIFFLHHIILFYLIITFFPLLIFACLHTQFTVWIGVAECCPMCGWAAVGGCGGWCRVASGDGHSWIIGSPWRLICTDCTAWHLNSKFRIEIQRIIT